MYIPFLRILGGKRVVFYCRFPDKLLANGPDVEGKVQRKNPSLLKWIYRYPMDWMEEVTTCTLKLCSIRSKRSDASRTGPTPKAVYPGINIEAYQLLSEPMDPEIVQVCS